MEPGNVRITEKRRLATAAAAIKQRMVNRRSPLVFLPVLPLKKGSDIDSAIVGGFKEKLSRMSMYRKEQISRSSPTHAVAGVPAFTSHDILQVIFGFTLRRSIHCPNTPILLCFLSPKPNIQLPHGA